MYDEKLSLIYDWVYETNLQPALDCLTSINGWNKETFNDFLYWAYGDNVDSFYESIVEG